MKKIRQYARAYSSFFSDFGHFSWLMGVVIYPILGAMFALWLAMVLHPLAFPLPLVPAFIIAIREDIRKRKAQLAGLKLISGKRIREATEEYIELMRKKKKGKGGD